MVSAHFLRSLFHVQFLNLSSLAFKNCFVAYCFARLVSNAFHSIPSNLLSAECVGPRRLLRTPLSLLQSPKWLHRQPVYAKSTYRLLEMDTSACANGANWPFAANYWRLSGAPHWRFVPIPLLNVFSKVFGLKQYANCNPSVCQQNLLNKLHLLLHNLWRHTWWIFGILCRLRCLLPTLSRQSHPFARPVLY